MKGIAWLLTGLTLIVSVIVSVPVWGQGYSELQEEQAKLDRESTDLQREIFQARLAHDDKKVEDLEKKLEPVQKRRVQVLQGLGHLPRN